MNIEQFAQQYHVQTKRDECSDTILAGKVWRSQPKDGYGHQIFDNGDGRFGLLLSFEVDNGHEIGGSGKSTKWANAQRKLISAGFTVKQNGDAEGVALFDPKDSAQSRLALKLAGIRVRRQLSPERKAALVAQLAAARTKAVA